MDRKSWEYANGFAVLQFGCPVCHSVYQYATRNHPYEWDESRRDVYCPILQCECGWVGDSDDLVPISRYGRPLWFVT